MTAKPKRRFETGAASGVCNVASVTSFIRLCTSVGAITALSAVQAVAGPQTTFGATGSDQAATAPVGAEGARVKLWGAGGGHEVLGTGTSGAGGYSEAEFDHTTVTGGASFTVVVGQGGNINGRPEEFSTEAQYLSGTGVGPGGSDVLPPYGFGSASAHDQGGGLTGFFSGAGTVLTTDTARALAIAGGGAGYEHSGGTGIGTTSGNGNSPSSGGQATMRGATDAFDVYPVGLCTPGVFPSAHFGGGGGGFQGGGRIASAVNYSQVHGNCEEDIAGAAGGSGFVAASAISSSIQFTADGNTTPPNTADADYVAGVGTGVGSVACCAGSSVPGGNGLAVVEWLIPSVETEKSFVLSDPDTNGQDAGDVVTFTIQVTNTGDFTLTSVGISSDTFERIGGPSLAFDGAGIVFSGNSGASPQGTLVPGEIATFTTQYTLVQADIDAGGISNSATGTGTPPSGNAVSDVSDDTDDTDGNTTDDPTVVPLTQTAELTTTKSVTTTGALQADGTFDVTFRVDVVNTGNVTLTSPTLVDDLEAEFADLFVPSTSATTTGGVIVAPALSGVTGATGITANAGFDGDGDDSLIDTTGTALLAPGDQFSVSFTITLDATQTAPVPTDNQATAGGTPPGGGAPVTDVSQNSATPGTTGSTPTPVTVPAVGASEFGLVKTAVVDVSGGADGASLDAGDTIEYTYTVTNPAGAVLNVLDITIAEVTTGATAFTGTNGAPTVISNDDGATLGGTGTLNDLAPGGLMTFSASYTLSQADIDAGSVTNSAIASGTDPGGNPVTDVSDESSPAPGNDDPTVVPLAPTTALQATLTAGTPTTGQGSNGSIPDAGDMIPYTLTITNTGSATVTGLSVASTTGLTVGACTPTQLAPGEIATCEVKDYTIRASDVSAGGVEHSVTATATTLAGSASVSDISDTGSGSETTNDAALFSTSDGDPTNDPTIVPLLALGANDTPLTETKSANQTSVLYGGTVVFSLTFENTTNQTLTDVTVHDRLPSGLIYTPGSATVDGTAREPEIGSTLSWDDITIPANGTVVVTIAVRVVSDEAGAELVNTTYATDPGGLALSNRARATVYQKIEQIFDCTDVIGKVYDDRNQNGYQDEGEPGLPGVRIATVRGELITTDQYGRYHVPCQALPADIGSNIILKIDTRTLPSGYRMTTENPRVMRATAGKMVRVNFGAAISTVIQLDLDATAFASATGADRGLMIQPLQAALDGLIADYASAPATLRLRYHVGSETRPAARRNLKLVETYMRRNWRARSKHQLSIEREMTGR